MCMSCSGWDISQGQEEKAAAGKSETGRGEQGGERKSESKQHWGGVG